MGESPVEIESWPLTSGFDTRAGDKFSADVSSVVGGVRSPLSGSPSWLKAVGWTGADPQIGSEVSARVGAKRLAR